MRTGTCLILFGLLIGVGAQAQQKTAPDRGKQSPINNLSAQKIADGWIQLFDGATDYGWKSRGEATWTVADGALQSEAGKSGALCTTTEFGNGDLHFECSHGPIGSVNVALRASADTAITPTNAAIFTVYDPAAARANASKKWGSAPKLPTAEDSWDSYDVVANGGIFALRVNGKPGGTFKGPFPARGYIALLTNSKDAVRFRNIRFRPTGLKRVFNGKDLTGWIAPEGNKSVFSVTKEGWLNLKGGRGDLQTIEQWGDFVLQIDVYSNGDHLNSGVFFRAEAGKFEQGYEDQIRNEWQGDDRTKPVDYGTGAVYNRLPVRKVVSSDREWFTMTLVAHGTHIGSWVNGVLVCDFTDMRPPDQTNARKGARTKAGVISLQGHEPDTDLNFRNIRIVELPLAAK